MIVSPAFTVAFALPSWFVTNASTFAVVTLNAALFTKFATVLAFKNALLSATDTVPFVSIVPVVVFTS